MINEKALAESKMYKVQLAKAEAALSDLRTEKEYYMKQLECVRKEFEALRSQHGSSQNVSQGSIHFFEGGNGAQVNNNLN
jgi:hypothetical protein